MMDDQRTIRLRQIRLEFSNSLYEMVPACPHCLLSNEAPREKTRKFRDGFYDGEEFSITCQHCGKEFEVSVSICTFFNTKKPDLKDVETDTEARLDREDDRIERVMGKEAMEKRREKLHSILERETK